MSEDEFFDSFDDAALQQIDAIEAAAISGLSPHKLSNNKNNAKSDDLSFSDLTFDIDESELQKLDVVVEASYENHSQAAAGPSRLASMNNSIQTTLYGGIASASSQRLSSTRAPFQRNKSSSRNVFGQQAPKTKVWDHTEFAKTGLKPLRKGKGKAKATANDNESEEEEEVEFEQFPAPFVPSEFEFVPPPMKLKPDLLEAKHWVFPLNRPKRDYQFNIVKRSLFENTLVALPTGLGKTFIAGVVMLNYYRWFPEGKVVFVAPTKPLVSQQIDACHQTCGIPGADAVELTGSVAKNMRARYWQEKRVFYMTPQTLVNDLVTENCNAQDIILLVVGGYYAYNQVIRFLMAKNPHFRVLALTATPGSTPDAVQNLIDGLHVSHVEIRDENSLDLRQYIHEKKIEQHVIKMSEDVDRVKILLSRLMSEYLKPLKQRGVLHFGDPVTFHPYAAQAKMQQLGREQRWALGPLSKLASLARAMGYLLEGTIGMCHTYLRQLSRASEPPEKGKRTTKPKGKNKWQSDPHFQAVMAELDNQHSRGFSIHPKMEILKLLLMQYFGERMGEDDDSEGASKAMVFVTFREAVDEIVQMLNTEQPLIRATKFVGQGTDKQGKKGMAQKEQLEVIGRFKRNEYNVLVATSIGEEGLDIGEVDYIVCYDAQKTPIRMLQRLGRTGRKRAGIVHVLLAQDREEHNMEKAKVTYKEVQKTIWRGDQLELYGDVERLLPDHVKPQCLEKVMEIKPYVPEEPYSKRKAEKEAAKTRVKRKRNDDFLRNIPMGASTGFVTVADLLVKNSKKRKKNPSPPSEEEKDFDMQGIDDDIDRELESGTIFPSSNQPFRRTKSSVAGKVTKSTKGTREKLRRVATYDEGTKKKAAARKGRQRKSIVDPTSSQGEDDSEDMELEQFTLPTTPRKIKRIISSPSNSPSPRNSSPRPATPELRQSPSCTKNGTIDLTDSESEPDHRAEPARRSSSPVAKPGRSKQDGEDFAWLVEDDEDMIFKIASSPPATSRVELPQSTTFEIDESVAVISPPVLRFPSDVNYSSARNIPSHVSQAMQTNDPDNESLIITSDVISLQEESQTLVTSPSNMSPPELPMQHITCVSQDPPTATMPVRYRHKKVVLFPDAESSPLREMPPPSQRRLYRRPAVSTPVKEKKKKPKMTALVAQHNLLFDVAADHSGDEVSEGGSNSEDDVESESDRMFIKDSPLTQVSQSYDQSLVYRQSLLSQAPAAIDLPRFAKGPSRSNIFGVRRGQDRTVLLSSSPARGDERSDEYEFGSFVVPDDVDVALVNAGSSLSNVGKHDSQVECHSNVQDRRLFKGTQSLRYSPLQQLSSRTALLSFFSTIQRRREDDEDKNVNDDDDDDVSLVSRSPSHEPMDVDTTGNDHISKYDEYHRGPEREIITVETRIKPTNKGFAMLAKLGWVEGQPLGISGEGKDIPLG
ncbi:hypothetical protein AMATHDRAFT_75437 [Amanita thiersii Skay4041]|uniref:ATP-dependent DNA helicase n=1 Tax=Amanita thiersii Skay4041 TaxID=703135 RepID=A0A2A9NSU6_9AGAR|nr:hypothetical protein AMATHDRAFT_75437 [Amanita thiersii Skay4041]